MNWLEKFFRKTAQPLAKRPLDNVTPRVQQLLVLARKEADRLQHNYVGTEHLLLGLIKLNEGVAVWSLQRVGIEMNALKARVDARLIQGKVASPPPSLPMTSELNKAFTLGQKEALSLGNDYLGTEHLILSLSRRNLGIASKALRELKVDVDQLRKKIIENHDATKRSARAQLLFCIHAFCIRK